jgi:hypothetical protein
MRLWLLLLIICLGEFLAFCWFGYADHEIGNGLFLGICIPALTFFVMLITVGFKLKDWNRKV